MSDAAKTDTPAESDGPDLAESLNGPNAAAFSGSAIPPEELERITTDIIAALKSVYDPEIPADIYSAVTLEDH